MKILASYNIKGGVGKTASAVNLAAVAAAEGGRTLLWDLDPQGAASFYFRIQPRIRGGSRRLLGGGRSLEEHIRGTDYEGLDLIPADRSYRHLDLQLDAREDPARALIALIDPLRGDYDYLFLDCAPGITLTAEAIFAAADALMVPTLPTTLSMRTLEQIRRHLAEHGPAGLCMLPFMCMVDRRKTLHRETCQLVFGGPNHFLRTMIGYSSIVERMGPHRAPLHAFAPRSEPALAYAALWREIKQRAGLVRRAPVPAAAWGERVSSPES